MNRTFLIAAIWLIGRTAFAASVAPDALPLATTALTNGTTIIEQPISGRATNDTQQITWWAWMNALAGFQIGPAGDLTAHSLTLGSTNVDGALAGKAPNTLAGITNALGLTGSTSTFLRSDGTQATPAGGGGGGIAGTVINTGASTANAIPAYSDTTGTNVAPSTVTIAAGVITATGALLATLQSSELYFGASRFNEGTLTPVDAGTLIDFSLTNRMVSCTITGAVVFVPTNMVAGKQFKVRIINGQATNCPVTLPAAHGQGIALSEAGKWQDVYLTSYGTTTNNLSASTILDP